MTARVSAAEARERVELALRYLEEGRALVERDPVQASEKLYRAAEEAVKALALHYGLSDILGSPVNVSLLGPGVRYVSTRLQP